MRIKKIQTEQGQLISYKDASEWVVRRGSDEDRFSCSKWTQKDAIEFFQTCFPKERNLEAEDVEGYAVQTQNDIGVFCDRLVAYLNDTDNRL